MIIKITLKLKHLLSIIIIYIIKMIITLLNIIDNINVK